MINGSRNAGSRAAHKLPKSDKENPQQELAALAATGRSITAAKARFLKKEFPEIEARYGKLSARKIMALHLEHFHMARLRNKIAILSVQLKAAQKAHAETLYKSPSALSKTGATVKDSKRAASLLSQ